jgi:hypothetical protein
MIEINPRCGIAEADEARISMLCCSEPAICEKQGETILAIVTKRDPPGHCQYHAQ